MGEIVGRCVIIGGGEIVDARRAAALLSRSDFVIAADSGYRHREALGVSPGLLVGDFDSIGAVPAGIPLVRLPADKDYTDTALAAEEALARGFRSLLFLGISGGRPDHTMANYQTLAGLSRRGVAVAATDGHNDTYAFTAPAQGKIFTVPFRPGFYFSVLAMGNCRNVTIRGGKYPLGGYDLRFDEARAVSNEFVDGDATVALDEGTILVMTTGPVPGKGGMTR